jgi:hypothetical protein
MSERGLPILEERLRTLKQFRHPRLGIMTAIAVSPSKMTGGRMAIAASSSGIPTFG